MLRESVYFFEDLLVEEPSKISEVSYVVSFLVLVFKLLVEACTSWPNLDSSKESLLGVSVWLDLFPTF